MKGIFVAGKPGRATGVLLLPLLAAPLALSGCGVTALREIARAGQAIKEQKAYLPVADVTAGEVAPLPPDEAVLEAALAQPPVLLPEIKPSNSGPGLIVCEPVIGDASRAAEKSAAQKSAADFGAGCGRWLHLAATGLPQFGKSASWYAFDYALREMDKTDGRVNPQEAAALAKILAATHVATGELSGGEGQSTLTYRLWKMPEREPVGAPIILRGSRAQITARLPEAAKTLAARLKGDVSLIPTKTEVSAHELESIGRAPRQTDFPADDATAQSLKSLAARSPLAGMQYAAHLFAVADDDDDAGKMNAVSGAARVLLQQAPQNTLVLGQATLMAPATLSDSAVLKNLLARFPNNYLLAYAETTQHSAKGQRDPQRRAAMRAIAAAPKSAWAWLQLESAISDAANDVRQGRYFGRMSESEQQLVSQAYPLMVEASLQAVRCDPLNADAWQRLSYAAAAISQDDLTDAAFWKTLTLPAHDDAAYGWGLQLYQPKWQDAPDKLRRVARLATADKARFVRIYWDVIDAFRDSGLHSEASQYSDLSVKALEAWLQEHPDDGRRRSAFGHLLKFRRDFDGAAQQFKILIEQQPTNDDGYHGLALIYEHRSDWNGALPNYLKAIEYDPENREALFRGGQCYHQLGNYRKAEVLYDKAIALYPDYAEPYNRLADLHYFVKNDRKGAEKLYRKAVELDPETQLFRDNLERCLTP